MQFERRKLADLHPADYNPRVLLTPDDPEYIEIKNSITEFGYADPIVVNYDGTIIKGHQRRNVMMDLGMEEADVIVLDIRDKTKEKALNVALNKITGKWDDAILKDLLVELDLEGYDFTVTGFQRQDLEDLIQLTDIPPEANDDGFDPDAAAESIDVPVTTRGDIWMLGRHRLMCGDSTDPEDCAALLAGEQLDLVITDPPYNVDYGEKTVFLESQRRGRSQNKIANDNMSDSAFRQFMLNAYRTINEAMRPGAAIYVFHSDVNGHIFRQTMIDAGFKFSQCLIWEKNSLVLGRSDYQWIHEPILYGWKEGAAHYFINDRTQTTVLLDEEIDLSKLKAKELRAMIMEFRQQYKDLTTVHYEKKPTKNDLHPTMKPVPLVGRLMNNSSRPGWLVGDFFGGSGSTLIAAEQLGRTAYIMEYDARNVDVIVRRWEEFTGEKAVLING